ncbi:MAG: tetratricopeptide repeat-containing sulfotransferase family protein [Planctomycetota bacterium]|jgi:tetratricopeptide (TPR) repeat protein
MTDFQLALDLRQAAAHLRSGDLGEAEAICQRVLRRRKKDVTALEMLARIANATRAFEKTASYLEKCVALRPRDPAMHFKLATVRVAQGRYDDAVAAFDKVLKLKPDYAYAVAWKADVLERRGDYEKARVLLEPFVTTGTLDAGMATVYATLHQRAGRHGEAIALAEEHVGRPDLEAAPRSRLWFLIGKCHEETGDLDRAFEAYGEANSAIFRRFDVESFAEYFDRLIETFSAPTLAALPRARNGSQRPIFVVGMPRTGSTLVEQIIDAHPQAHGAGEIAAMINVARSWRETPGSLPYPEYVKELTQEAADRLGRRYLDDLARIRRGGLRMVDKYLGNFQHLGLIEVLLPQARVIDCRRDPLDTCLSCYVSALDPDDHPYACDLGSLGLVYGHYERLMRHWQEVLKLRMMEVRYEDLVADQERVTRAIIDFCGLEWDDRCLRYYESKRTARTLSYEQVRRPIYRSSISRAAKFDEYLGPLKEALAEGST